MGRSPGTLTRWQRRLSRGQAAIGRRGPRYIKPLNLSALRERIHGLGHGSKRSRGSGAVLRAYAGVISRRELDAMVRAVRSETSRRRMVETYHVSWLRPNVAWAMDDCQKTERAVGGTLHLHNLTEVYRWIQELAAEVATRAGNPVITPAA